MRRYVLDVVSASDDAVWIDEVGVTHRVLRIVVTFRTGNLVQLADRSIHVAQQTERKALILCERKVVLRGVERRAEDDYIELFETLGAVTQALALFRSTRCRRFRIPPQEHPATTEIRQADAFAMLIRKVEIGSDGVQLEHGHIFARSVPRRGKLGGRLSTKDCTPSLKSDW